MAFTDKFKSVFVNFLGVISSQHIYMLFIIYEKIASFSVLYENEAILLAEFYLQQSDSLQSSQLQQGVGGSGEGCEGLSS